MHRPEVEQQVLAASPDALQRRAVCLVRPRHGCLQRGEVEGDELRQDRTAELLAEPFGVGLHLGQLGHLTAPPLDVLGALAHAAEHDVEGTEHRL